MRIDPNLPPSEALKLNKQWNYVSPFLINPIAAGVHKRRVMSLKSLSVLRRSADNLATTRKTTVFGVFDQDSYNVQDYSAYLDSLRSFDRQYTV